MGFERLYEGAYRLKIPFDGIYTSVFLLFGEGGCILADGGSDANDAEKFILPSMRAFEAPTLLVCSHLHNDHCGGIARLLDEYPSSKVGLLAKSKPFQRAVLLQDGEKLLGRYAVLALRGHTADLLGLFDEQTKTLFSFDCLQGRGVGRYSPTFVDEEAYARTIERLFALKPQRIVASHDYRPYGYLAEGASAVRDYLKINIRKN